MICRILSIKIKLFDNFVSYFIVIWVICGEITYTSNIIKIDPAKINSKVFSQHNFWLILKFVEIGPLAQYWDSFNVVIVYCGFRVKCRILSIKIKLSHNFVTYFNVIWVICGEITCTSNIIGIDAAKINFKVFSQHNFLLFLKFVEIGPLAQYWDSFNIVIV